MFHIRRPHYDRYNLKFCMVGVFELPVLHEHAYDVQMQAIGGSRIRVYHSSGALSSLRLLRSPISIPTLLAILPNILALWSPLSFVFPSSPRLSRYVIEGWPCPESPDDRIDIALPNILTGASFSSHLLPVFSLFTTLKNDSWHPLESSVSRIDNPQSSIKTKQPFDHHMGVTTCWIGYWIQSTFAFKLMRTRGKRCIMHEIHGSCFPEAVWPRTMIEGELGLL